MNRKNCCMNLICWGRVFLVVALPSAFVHAADARTAANRPIDFKRDVAPIFVKRCSECHGPDVQKSKLRLDNKADAFKGGKSGKPTIVPGKSSESEIIR